MSGLNLDIRFRKMQDKSVSQVLNAHGEDEINFVQTWQALSHEVHNVMYYSLFRFIYGKEKETIR